MPDIERSLSKPLPLTLLFLAQSCGSAAMNSERPASGIDGSAGSAEAGGDEGGADGGMDSAGTAGNGDASRGTTEGGATSPPPSTFCNPLNIEYRFSAEAPPSRREGADPVIILYEDNYYLFASKSGAYWYSSDMVTWTQVRPNWPASTFEEYAPTAWSIGGTLYFATTSTVMSTTDPKSGNWTVLGNNFQSLQDLDYFVDDDGRVGPSGFRVGVDRQRGWRGGCAAGA
jgi:hypothetical protein